MKYCVAQDFSVDFIANIEPGVFAAFSPQLIEQMTRQTDAQRCPRSTLQWASHYAPAYTSTDPETGERFTVEARYRLIVTGEPQ